MSHPHPGGESVQVRSGVFVSLIGRTFQFWRCAALPDISSVEVRTPGRPEAFQRLPPSVRALHKLQHMGLLPFCITLLLFVCSQGWATTPVFLSPGEFETLHEVGRSPVSVENGKVIGISDLGTSLRVTGKRVGTSLLTVSDKALQVYVVPGGIRNDVKEIFMFLEDKRGLELKWSQQKGLIVSGRLLRVSDWQELAELSLKLKFNYVFEAQIVPEIQGDVKFWLHSVLKKAGISMEALALNPRPALLLDPGYQKNQSSIGQRVQHLGLPVTIDPRQISQKPSVMLSLVLAEVDQTFEQEIGILWGTETAPGVYRTTVLPKYVPGELSAKLTAMESSGKGRVLAKPQLLSRSGEKAEFHAGGEIPIQISGWGSQSVEWKKYGIMMNFHPLADNHGRMSLSVESEVSIPDLSQTTGQLPIFEVNRVKSHFDLDKSRTVVISGLVRDSENHFRQGLPFVSRIPVIGRLFGSPKYRQRKTELLIFVTPQVLLPYQLDNIKPEKTFGAEIPR